MNDTETTETITLAQAFELATGVLLKAGVSSDQTAAIARNVVAAEADACHSHGLYRLIGYVKAATKGLANARAIPHFERPTPAVLRVDAKRGFAPLAVETGHQALIEAAKTFGLATLVINQCFHNSALWLDIEPVAEAGLAAIAMTAGQQTVAPHGGNSPVFGTNPFAFAWPRAGQAPFIFDLATSAVARGEIELHQRAGKPIPQGWGITATGLPTTDPAAALAGALLPFGGHKGTALALMVELMAGPLIGDLTSAQARTLDAGVGAPPLGGEIIVAFDPAILGGPDNLSNMAAAETVFADILAQPGARLAGERRLAARAVTKTKGVAVPRDLLDELRQLA